MKDEQRVVLSAEVASQIHQAMIEASERAKAAHTALKDKGEAAQAVERMAEAATRLQKAVGDDDFWAGLLVRRRELLAAGRLGKSNDGLNVAHAVAEPLLKSSQAILFLHIEPLVQVVDEPDPVEA